MSGIPVSGPTRSLNENGEWPIVIRQVGLIVDTDTLEGIRFFDPPGMTPKSFFEPGSHERIGTPKEYLLSEEKILRAILDWEPNFDNDWDIAEELLDILGVTDRHRRQIQNMLDKVKDLCLTPEGRKTFDRMQESLTKPGHQDPTFWIMLAKLTEE